MTLKKMRERCERASGGLGHALDRERRKAALAEVIAPFQRGGPLAYLPAKEGRIPAEQAWLDGENRRASFALYHLERALMDVTPALASLKAQAMRPMTAEQAWEKRTNKPGLSAEAYLQLHTLEELRRMRLGPELRSSSPSSVLARYREALADADDQHNATLIAVVEQLHGEKWAGPEVQKEELAHVIELRKQIRDVRESRVPEEILELEATVERMRTEASRAATLHKVVALNPAHLGVEEEVEA
jgi:hypothetical protein